MKIIRNQFKNQMGENTAPDPGTHTIRGRVGQPHTPSTPNHPHPFPGGPSPGGGVPVRTWNLAHIYIYIPIGLSLGPVCVQVSKAVLSINIFE